MSLMAGARLGPYEITGAIGAGGMGEVFRARDTKLNRDVAIKVLPAEFAQDHERVARFKREAQVLASLNHPNIAGIYGLEEGGAGAGGVDPGVRRGDGKGAGSGAGSEIRSVAPANPLLLSREGASAGVHFPASGAGPGTIVALIMELVEGEDLSTLIARGPIPIAEALPIARQLAEALEAAHEQGIVHRDLKPGNIKVRADGTVKVLDFGLAKAMDPAGASASNPNVSHSPTLTHQGTQAGMIIGTAAYMSPEQAKGKPVDKRADIWAFGVVLYEMLTGKRAFKGEDVSETLAAVLMTAPPIDALPAATPPRLKRLIERCLDRDLKTRLRDIGEARVKIARIESGAPEPLAAAGSQAGSPAPVSRVWPLATGALALALLGTLVTWAPWRTAPVPAPRKLLASIGVDASLVVDRGAAAILSPDGTTLAFVAQKGGLTQLFIRKLDQLQATPLAGTDSASYPFFSPDGEWVAFFAGGKLKKVQTTGGSAVSLCDAQAGRGGTWAEDDTIIFSPDSAGPLVRVAAGGGTPTKLGAQSGGATTQRWPQVLAGGKMVLYTENVSQIGGFEDANVVIAPLETAGGRAGTAKVLVRGAYYGRYVPSGHLVYVQQGTLFAVPFDPVRLETTGAAAPALEGFMTSGASGGAQVAFASDGTLVYAPGDVASTAHRIDWIGRDGKVSVLRAEKANWLRPRFSPDGRELALTINDGRQNDVWVYELARDTLRQLTFDPANDYQPVWTPDGRRIVFGSDRARTGTNNLYWVNADGTGEVTRLTESSETQYATSWDPSGRFLAFVATRPGTANDLMILPMKGDTAATLTPGTPTVFLGTPKTEFDPQFSPDGRFIAYLSREGTGVSDLYVRPFPGPGGPWRVSAGFASFPRWSPRGHELLFTAQDKIMFAPYVVQGDSFRADKPRVWSPTSIWRGAAPSYDIHPDGERVAAAALEGGDAAQDKLVFVFNFFDYLKKIAPTKKP